VASNSLKTPAEIDQGPLARYTRRFYRDVLTQLEQEGIPVLVGGAFAFTHFTGIQRPTKDFDVFLRREHVDDALRVLARAGFDTELSFPHWLAKARSDEFFVDLIFGSGNGVAPVDDEWFAHAVPTEVVGVPVRLCPPEEMLWSKAFIMERERYDGADVVHIIHECHRTLDWRRVHRRFDAQWRVLLMNLVLYGFVYPGHPSPAPRWLMDDLLGALRAELDASPREAKVCRGTLISRQQYLPDIEEWGYSDARLEPSGTMSADEVAQWTAAIEKERK
jgi:hypothetical protein